MAVYGRGENAYLQLSQGTPDNHQSPVQIMDNVLAVSSGWRHTSAVTAEGRLWAWGQNDEGQVGDGTTFTRPAPVQVLVISSFYPQSR